MKNKLAQWMTPGTAKNRRIVSDNDANDLERDSAIHEFRNGHTREDAEDLAYADYRKKSHMNAAGYHYAAMRAASGAGEREDAKRHKLLFDMHMKGAGHNPEDPIPDEIRNYMENPNHDRVFKFKPHKADILLDTGLDKSEVDFAKAEDLKTLGEWIRRNDPDPKIVKLYQRLGGKSLKKIHHNLQLAARAEFRQHKEIKHPSIASHYRAAHEAMKLRRSEIYPGAPLMKGDVINLPTQEGPAFHNSKDADVIPFQLHHNERIFQSHPDSKHYLMRLRTGNMDGIKDNLLPYFQGSPAELLNKVKTGQLHDVDFRSGHKLSDLLNHEIDRRRDAWQKSYNQQHPELSKNADEADGTAYQPSCPKCKKNSGVSKVEKHDKLFCKDCNLWFDPPHEHVNKTEFKDLPVFAQVKLLKMAVDNLSKAAPSRLRASPHYQAYYDYATKTQGISHGLANIRAKTFARQNGHIPLEQFTQAVGGEVTKPSLNRHGNPRIGGGKTTMVPQTTRISQMADADAALGSSRHYNRLAPEHQRNVIGTGKVRPWANPNKLGLAEGENGYADLSKADVRRPIWGDDDEGNYLDEDGNPESVNEAPTPVPAYSNVIDPEPNNYNSLDDLRYAFGTDKIPADFNPIDASHWGKFVASLDPHERNFLANSLFEHDRWASRQGYGPATGPGVKQYGPMGAKPPERITPENSAFNVGPGDQKRDKDVGARKPLNEVDPILLTEEEKKKLGKREMLQRAFTKVPDTVKQEIWGMVKKEFIKSLVMDAVGDKLQKARRNRNEFEDRGNPKEIREDEAESARAKAQQRKIDNARYGSDEPYYQPNKKVEMEKAGMGGKLAALGTAAALTAGAVAGYKAKGPFDDPKKQAAVVQKVKQQQNKNPQFKKEIDPKEIVEGSAEEEREHHLGPQISGKIAGDHLNEDPNYYKKSAIVDDIEEEGQRPAPGIKLPGQQKVAYNPTPFIPGRGRRATIQQKRRGLQVPWQIDGSNVPPVTNPLRMNEDEDNVRGSRDYVDKELENIPVSHRTDTISGKPLDHQSGKVPSVAERNNKKSEKKNCEHKSHTGLDSKGNHTCLDCGEKYKGADKVKPYSGGFQPETNKSEKIDPNKLKVRDEGIRSSKLPPGAPGANKHGVGVQKDKKKEQNKRAARDWKDE